MRSVLPFAAALVVLGLSTTASAQETQLPEPSFGSLPAPDYAAGATILRPTGHWSILKEDRTSGFGGGLALTRYPNAGPWNFGAFADTQIELDGAWRSSAGFQAGFGPFGMRLGASHRSEGDFAATTNLLIAKTATFGPVGMVWHLGIPLR
ncbi:MAG: hypothetical protein AAGH15_20980, partial [Myxococcota bacterium]